MLYEYLMSFTEELVQFIHLAKHASSFKATISSPAAQSDGRETHPVTIGKVKVALALSCLLGLRGLHPPSVGSLSLQHGISSLPGIYHM